MKSEKDKVSADQITRGYSLPYCIELPEATKLLIEKILRFEVCINLAFGDSIPAGRIVRWHRVHTERNRTLTHICLHIAASAIWT